MPRDTTNLLILMSDEHNADFMSGAGHPYVRTPNLDRLAERGTSFDTAYTNCPICVPSRASFATGRFIHDIGYWDNSLAYDGRVPSWGHRLREGGIRADSIGKLHYRNAVDDTGFDHQIIPMHIKDGVGMLQGSIRGQFPDFKPARQGPMRGGIVPGAAAGETTYTKYDRKIAELACDWLKTAANEGSSSPWVLFVSLVSPHYPLVAPAEFFELYDADELPLPLLDPEGGYVPHAWSERLTRLHSGADVTTAMKRRALAAYAALCTFVDAQIGRVLDTLETTGLTARTRVIYTSDHGECAGVRGMWGKSVMYREATQVPLIISGADIPAAHRCRTPVSLVDAYPTILAAAGIAVDGEKRPGRSLLDVANAADHVERLAFSEYHAMRSPSAAYMIRRGRYKYHHYVGYAPELFDVIDDPHEIYDIAALPGSAPIVAEYERLLRTIVDPEATDARAKADQKALVERHGGPEAVLARAEGGRNFTEVPPEVEAVLG